MSSAEIRFGLTHLFCYHAQFFEVDQAFDCGVVCQVNKCQIFLHHRVKGNYWGLHIFPID